jgi:hypothetical protein
MIRFKNFSAKNSSKLIDNISSFFENNVCYKYINLKVYTRNESSIFVIVIYDDGQDKSDINEFNLLGDNDICLDHGAKCSSVRDLNKTICYLCFQSRFNIK